MHFLRFLAPILALIALVSVLPGCSRSHDRSKAEISTNTQTYQIPDTYTTYTEETGVFSVSYPAEWETTLMNMDMVKTAIDSSKSDVSIEATGILFTARLETEYGWRSPSVNIVVQPCPEWAAGFGVDFVARGVTTLLATKQLITDYHEVEWTDARVNGRDVVLVEYTGYPAASTTRYHNLMLILLSGKTVWGLNCAVADESYSYWATDFQNIAHSLKVGG